MREEAEPANPGILPEGPLTAARLNRAVFRSDSDDNYDSDDGDSDDDDYPHSPPPPELSPADRARYEDIATALKKGIVYEDNPNMLEDLATTEPAMTRFVEACKSMDQPVISRTILRRAHQNPLLTTRMSYFGQIGCRGGTYGSWLPGIDPSQCSERPANGLIYNGPDDSHAILKNCHSLFGHILLPKNTRVATGGTADRGADTASAGSATDTAGAAESTGAGNEAQYEQAFVVWRARSHADTNASLPAVDASWMDQFGPPEDRDPTNGNVLSSDLPTWTSLLQGIEHHATSNGTAFRGESVHRLAPPTIMSSPSPVPAS